MKNLEKELHSFKTKYRKLEQVSEDSGKVVAPPTQTTVESIGGDNMLIRSHVETLNNTIGTLCLHVYVLQTKCPLDAGSKLCFDHEAL